MAGWPAAHPLLLVCTSH